MMYSQGEQMALVAALESLPQLYASPLASALFYYLLHTPSAVFGVFVAILTVAVALLWCAVRHENELFCMAGDEPSAAEDERRRYERTDALLVNEAPTAVGFLQDVVPQVDPTPAAHVVATPQTKPVPFA